MILCSFQKYYSQSYQDDVRVIMKDCVQLNPDSFKSSPPPLGIGSGTGRLAG